MAVGITREQCAQALRGLSNTITSGSDKELARAVIQAHIVVLEGEGSGQLAQRAELLTRIEGIAGLNEVHGQDTPARVGNLKARSDRLRLVEGIAGFEELPGGTTNGRVQALVQVFQTLQGAPRFMALEGEGVAGKLANLNGRLELLSQIEGIEGFGELPGGTTNGRVGALVQVFRALENSERFMALDGEGVAAKLANLNGRLELLSQIEGIERFEEFPGETTNGRVQALVQVFRALEGAPRFMALQGEGVAAKLENLNARLELLSQIEGIDRFGELPGATTNGRVAALVQVFRGLEGAPRFMELDGEGVVGKLANLNARLDLVRQLEEIPAFAALDGATTADKIANLQARLGMLAQIEALPGFGEGVNTLVRVQGLVQRVGLLEDDLVVARGAQLPAFENTMAQAVEVINALLGMFPGSFDTLRERVDAADEARFQAAEFGALAGIRAAVGANNKERALYLLGQTTTLQGYMGARHVVEHQFPGQPVNNDAALIERIDALQAQLNRANSALEGFEGADLGEKVVELRRKHDEDHTFIGGVKAVFWGVVETIMNIVSFIFTYTLDSLRALAGAFSRS